MAWTAPRTWIDIVSSASHFNIDIRDNQLALKAPPTGHYEANEGGDYSITGSVWTDLTNMTATITTTGGDVMVGFTFTANSAGNLDINVDGTRIINRSQGGVITVSSSTPRCYSFVRMIRGLSAASHTIKIQAKSSVTLTIYAGAGTANYDVHPQFWVREIS